MINWDRLERNWRNCTFVYEIMDHVEPHPFNRNLMYIPSQGVVIELTDGFDDGTMTLGYIQTLDKGQGHGSSALKWFLKIAKRHNMVINIDCERVGNEGLTQSQLKAWYKRHGFSFPRNGKEGSISYA